MAKPRAPIWSMMATARGTAGSVTVSFTARAAADQFRVVGGVPSMPERAPRRTAARSETAIPYSVPKDERNGHGEPL